MSIDVRILATSEYVPQNVLDNAELARTTGKDEDWFLRRTGIVRRRRAGPGENSGTMAVAAVRALPRPLDVPIDLIIGASYTPWDTIGTSAHVVQREFQIEGARAFEMSAACSSFVNALEVACTFIETGRSRRALIVATEHNSLYSDQNTNHLWGDGASAVLLGAATEPPGNPSAGATAPAFDVLAVRTYGRATLGSGPGAVTQQPRGVGLTMPVGREVFQHACDEMEAIAREILGQAGMTPSDLALVVAHQANLRIIHVVADRLGVPGERIAVTIDELGNTGSASVPITLHRYSHRVPANGMVLLLAFGGGYSVGGALLRRRDV